MKKYRHGDLALIGVKALPKGLKKVASHILMTGSGGLHHTFDRGQFSPLTVGDGLTFGFLEAKKTTLAHYEHGNICSACGYSNLVKVSVCPQCGTDFIRDKKPRYAKLADGAYQHERCSILRVG